MLLDHELVNSPPELDYTEIKNNKVFIGTVISHMYDEKRISLNETNSYKPNRYFFTPYINSTKIFLYGDIFDPIGKDVFLFNKLRNRNNLDLITYNKILQEFEYECVDNFLKLNQGVYPIDSVYIKKYINDFNYENLIKINTEVSSFQQLPTIYMLLLINNN
jgi:hypothetical protein